ncbi:MAG: class I SAM-dependent methyltransferase [bacterium]
MENRHKIEKSFHDKAFSEGVRGSVDKFYSITKTSKAFFERTIEGNRAGSKILEIGCGTGYYSNRLAKLGFDVTGIDLSDSAIEIASKKAVEENIDSVSFQIMNAESLAFPDKHFDLVFGSGILHHLDLSVVLPEISRVLAPGGEAVFFEPLGHNPVINAWRKRTPELRTSSEHPLVISDMKIMRKYFDRIETRFFHFFSLGAYPFRKSKSFEAILNSLGKIDDCTFSIFPFLKKYAWIIVLILRSPHM